MRDSVANTLRIEKMAAAEERNGINSEVRGAFCISSTQKRRGQEVYGPYSKANTTTPRSRGTVQAMVDQKGARLRVTLQFHFDAN